MICKNCGGEYDGSERYCPYCKSENLQVAESLKEEKLKKLDADYRREKQRLETQLPKQTVRKGTKTTLILLGSLLGIIVLSVVAIVVGGIAIEAGERKQTAHNREQLEKYFQAGQYEEMSAYLYDKAGYAEPLRKYRETAQVYKTYTKWIMRLSDEWQEYAADSFWEPQDNLYILQDMLQYAEELFECCEEWCSDMSFCDNEEVLKDFEGKTEMLLRNTYHMTDEQIELLKQGGLTDEQREQLSETVMEQWLQK